MATSKTGLAATAVILAVNVLLPVAGILYGACIKSEMQVQQKATVIRWSGTAASVLTASLGVATLVVGSSEGRTQGTEGNCVDADADIVGDGVRAAAWVQTGMITILASLGLLTSETASAIKELGGGLVITNASLSVALLVPLARRDLPPIDAILGALVLDALVMPWRSSWPPRRRWQPGGRFACASLDRRLVW